jgi:probable rRNA maturation factor
MMLEVEVQVALETRGLPATAEFRRWVEAALAGADYKRDAEVVIRIVNEAESASLNRTYRHKAGATNVLSFPFAAPAGVAIDLLGDVVICAPVVVAEAVAQHKELPAHWAHLVIHGVLHLLGYDHQDAAQAEAIEQLEIRILADLGYPNPYGEMALP